MCSIIAINNSWQCSLLGIEIPLNILFLLTSFIFNKISKHCAPLLLDIKFTNSHLKMQNTVVNCDVIFYKPPKKFRNVSLIIITTIFTTFLAIHVLLEMKYAHTDYS